MLERSYCTVLQAIVRTILRVAFGGFWRFRDWLVWVCRPDMNSQLSAPANHVSASWWIPGDPPSALIDKGISLWVFFYLHSWSSALERPISVSDTAQPQSGWDRGAAKSAISVPESTSGSVSEASVLIDATLGGGVYWWSERSTDLNTASQ